jgi:hypothetical protein
MQIPLSRLLQNEVGFQTKENSINQLDDSLNSNQ